MAILLLARSRPVFYHTLVLVSCEKVCGTEFSSQLKTLQFQPYRHH